MMVSFDVTNSILFPLVRQMKPSYHKWTLSTINEWLTKSTPEGLTPPKSKHVRRVILAISRDETCTPLFITQILYNQRPWKSDICVSAKCLSIILLSLQYVQQLQWSNDFKGMIYQIQKGFPINFISVDDKKFKYLKISQCLANSIIWKAKLHMTFPFLEGNFHIQKELNNKNLINELQNYIIHIGNEIKKLNDQNISSLSFNYYVLIKPLIEEACSAFICLRAIDQSSTTITILMDLAGLLKLFQTIPYLSTSIVYPTNDQPFDVPHTRFPQLI